VLTWWLAFSLRAVGLAADWARLLFGCPCALIPHLPGCRAVRGVGGWT